MPQFQLLPEAPSFGSQLGAALGGGISQGLSASLNSYLENKKQQTALNNMLSALGISPQGQQAKKPSPLSDEDFISKLPAIEQQLGRDLTPQDLDQLYSSMQAQSGMGALQQGFPSQQQQSGIGNLTPEKVIAASAMAEKAGFPHLGTAIGSIYQQQQKEAAKEKEREFIPQKEYIEHSAKQNSEFLNEISQSEKDLPITDFSISMIEDSLGDAGKWAAFRDRITETTGFEGFRSAAGAELDSAIKSYFLGDLSSIKGGRPNVFIEKQIREAYPKAGRDPISNQKIVLGMKMKEQINRLKVEKARELEDKFISQQGYLPPQFKSIVNKEIRSQVEEIEKNAIKQLHNMSRIQESRDKIFRTHLKSGEILMMDNEGNPFAVKKKEVPAYRERGFVPMGEK